MNQHLHIITLGVSHFKTSVEFYSRILGWKASSNSNDDIAFFQAGGVVLAIFPGQELAKDALVEPDGPRFSGFTMAYNARSESEVEAIVADLRSKGVRIVKEPQKVYWGGYSSYFAFDEHGNLKLE